MQRPEDSDAPLHDALDALRAEGLRWANVEVAAPSASATVLHAALRPVISVDGARRWWFIRKPPGVRVRVEAAGDHQAIEDGLVEALSKLGPVRATPYEPESFRFGGPGGMDAAHDHFSFDSALAVLAERHGSAVGARAWSVAALADLSARVTDDDAECWDAWKRLEAILSNLGGVGVTPSTDHSPVDLGPVPTALQAALGDGNARVASALRAADLTGGVGPRTWFCAVAIFHWNRLGFGPAEMATVVADVLSGLE